MNKFITLITLFSASLIIAGSAFAAGESTCEEVYGGGEVCRDEVKFTVNKLVQNKSGQYVENLSMNDPRYSPNQNVNFKIVIENKGDRDIENLNVVDTFPDHLTFLAGVGNTQSGSHEIKYTVGKLEKGKKVEYTLTAKTHEAAKLPNDKAIICESNSVRVFAMNGAQATDKAQVCIEKTINPTPIPELMQKPQVNNIPATGPELLALGALIPMGALGMFLRRRAS